MVGVRVVARHLWFVTDGHDALTLDRAAISACSTSDAMDRFGLTGTLPAMISLTSCKLVVGPAYTVRFRSNGSGAFNDYVPEVPPGSVLVIDAGGRTDVSAFGGIIAAEARRVGILGTVIHGACRDVGEINDLGYPVFALGSTPSSGRGVISSDECEVDLAIDGVPIRPGDTVVADADGVVVVPRERSVEILEVAKTIAQHDEKIRQLVLRGNALADARARVQ